MKPRAFKLVLISLLLGLAPGCSTYRHRLADDFRDAVKLNVGLGTCIYARAKVTSFLDGAGGAGGYWVDFGLDGRHAGLAHARMDTCYFPAGILLPIPNVSKASSLRMAHDRFVYGPNGRIDHSKVGQIFDAAAVTKWDAYGPTKKSSHPIFHYDHPMYTEQPLGVELGLGLLLLNAHVGLDPVEIVDLLCTLCGWDLLKDNDCGKPTRRESPGNPVKPREAMPGVR